MEQGAVPLLLGGEHTVTLGAVQAFRAAERPFGVVQFDAHADLRDTYEGTPYSHACVMRRVAELGVPIVQVGVRSCSPAERAFRDVAGLPHLDAAEIHANGVRDLPIPESFPADVYVTFDIDAFDASLMPATGTPEPGGLFWHQAVPMLRSLARRRRIVGADVVELAPQAGLHACDYTAARLVHVLMACIAAGA
jgi:agmatinase